MGAVDVEVGSSTADLAGAAFAVVAAALVEAPFVGTDFAGEFFAGAAFAEVGFSEAFAGADVPDASFDPWGSAGATFAGVDFVVEDFVDEAFVDEAFEEDDFDEDAFEDSPALLVERARVGLAGVGLSELSVEPSVDTAEPREVVDRVDAPRPRR